MIGVTLAARFAVDFDEIGPDLFRAVCDLGLEGLVSKHHDRPYQAVRSKHWVKIKNRKRLAMERMMETYRAETSDSAASRRGAISDDNAMTP